MLGLMLFDDILFIESLVQLIATKRLTNTHMIIKLISMDYITKF